MTTVERCNVWQTLRATREPHRVKWLGATALCFQKTVKTEGETRQYEGCAKRWREDEERAFSTLDALYNSLRKQIMRITAAQQVWEPMGDAGSDPSASSSSAPATHIDLNGTASQRKRPKREDHGSPGEPVAPVRGADGLARGAGDKPQEHDGRECKDQGSAGESTAPARGSGGLERGAGDASQEPNSGASSTCSTSPTLNQARETRIEQAEPSSTAAASTPRQAPQNIPPGGSGRHDVPGEMGRKVKDKKQKYKVHKKHLSRNDIAL